MNFANKISTFRILTVPFFIAALIYYAPCREYLRFVALGIFCLAGISDAVDGYIARRSGQKSKAGLVLDPIGDKLLLMSAFILLSDSTGVQLALKFPFWVVLIVLSRDVIIILGSVVIYMVRQKIEIIPSKWGKYTTIAQMTSVIVVLLQLRAAPVIWWVVAVLTMISGLLYIKKGLKVLYGNDNCRDNV
ncbi:MAG: CDP-alcohol phosphatidyltransferase family protein [Candidatus Omnitrophota bacterium]|jgi:cardiolipin synthase